MDAILPKLMVLGLILGEGLARAESAELKHRDEITRSIPEHYTKGWTSGLTYCFGDGLDYESNDFLRTTKAVGHQNLKRDFEYAENLGKPLPEPYVEPGEEPPPPEPRCDFSALGEASDTIAAMTEPKAVLFAGTGKIACEGPELTFDERDAVAHKTVRDIAPFEPVLTKSLRAARIEGPPRVRPLITGARKLDENAEKDFSRCEREYWWRYKTMERLSCQLYIMKLRMEFLSRYYAQGEVLPFRCYNDKPPAKIENAGPGEHLSGSDITGLGSH